MTCWVSVQLGHVEFSEKEKAASKSQGLRFYSLKSSYAEIFSYENRKGQIVSALILYSFFWGH